MQEETFLQDVERRLRAIGDAKLLQTQIRCTLDQLAELERQIGARGYAALGVSGLLTEAAEANARLQGYAQALAGAERIIRETAYCLPMLTYQGGETDGLPRG